MNVIWIIGVVIVALAAASAYFIYPKTVAAPAQTVTQVSIQASSALDQQLNQDVSSISNQDIMNVLNSPS